METTKIVLFEGKKIRKIWRKNEWWFSVIDVITVLTDSADPRDYWYKMKVRVKDESTNELSTNCRQLKLQKSAIQKTLKNLIRTPKTAAKLRVERARISKNKPANASVRKKIT